MPASASRFLPFGIVQSASGCVSSQEGESWFIYTHAAGFTTERKKSANQGSPRASSSEKERREDKEKGETTAAWNGWNGTRNETKRIYTRANVPRTLVGADIQLLYFLFSRARDSSSSRPVIRVANSGQRWSTSL